jgi:hypothetical protein
MEGKVKTKKATVAVLILWALCGAACAADGNSLVSLWEFEEGWGTTAYDSVGNNHGTLKGDPSWVEGFLGGGLDFDGYGDYVEVADDDSLTPGSAITVAFWIYNRGGQDAGIFKYASCAGAPQSPGNSRAYHVTVTDSTGQARLTIFSAVNTYDTILSSGIVTLNAWHHIAATFDAGQAALYIDGQPDNSDTLSVSSIMNDAHPLLIGGLWTYCQGAEFLSRLNGTIDDVRIYDSALTADEIQEVYEWGLCGQEHPYIYVCPGILEYYAEQAGPNPQAQSFSIRNMGAGVLNYQIIEDCSWLEVDPNMGSSTGEPNQVAVSVDISGLAWGVYDCDITISDPCACNHPETVEVTVMVYGPEIELSSHLFQFTAALGAPNPEAQTLAIRNIGGGTLNWTITDGCNWLEADPNTGSSTGEANEVMVSVDISGLAWGVYDCNLTISDANACCDPQTVEVALRIGTASTRTCFLAVS